MRRDHIETRSRKLVVMMCIDKPQSPLVHNARLALAASPGLICSIDGFFEFHILRVLIALCVRFPKREVTVFVFRKLKYF